mgnify:CR=1 FL=1
MRSDERSLTSMVLKEIENQIEDKVVPVISSIMGSGRAREHTASLCGEHRQCAHRALLYRLYRAFLINLLSGVKRCYLQVVMGSPAQTVPPQPQCESCPV